MLTFRRAFLGIGMLLVALFAVACGSNSTTSTGSSGTTPSSSAAIIKTSSATVNGQSVTILTNTKGMTLYYFKPDTATTSACTGSCAGFWPPLVSTSSGSPASASALPGTLSVVTDANGQQVEYNGHMLYTYLWRYGTWSDSWRRNQGVMVCGYNYTFLHSGSASDYPNKRWIWRILIGLLHIPSISSWVVK